MIVLDANPGITAERENFTRAFTVTHAGVIDYVPNAPVISVDAATRTVHTAMGPFRGDVLNVIPTNVRPAPARRPGNRQRRATVSRASTC